MSLASLPTVERLSERVVRVMGLNPGPMTLQGTCTYIVGTGNVRILVDAGEGIGEYSELLRQTLETEGATISTIVLTHHHYDHVGGVQSVLAMLQQHAPASSPPRILKQRCASEDAHIPFYFEHIDDAQVVRVDGATLRALYTPGHTRDHTCFALVEEEAIFCGDTVLGHGTCVFQNLKTYMSSLRALLAAAPRHMYPGHGPRIADAVPFVQTYIAHREARERQIADALQARPGDAPASGDDLVAIIYPDLGANLKSAALGNVLLHLGKLWLEQRVVAHDGAAHVLASDDVCEDKARMLSLRWSAAALHSPL